MVGVAGRLVVLVAVPTPLPCVFDRLAPETAVATVRLTKAKAVSLFLITLRPRCRQIPEGAQS
jgi:hypothetical protein